MRMARFLTFPISFTQSIINRMLRQAQLAMFAAARPTNNNTIESRWSILTGKYISGMRNGRRLPEPERQPDLQTFPMKQWLTLHSFKAIVMRACRFLSHHFRYDGPVF
jgi:hypothetical protein